MICGRPNKSTEYLRVGGRCFYKFYVHMEVTNFVVMVLCCCFFLAKTLQGHTILCLGKKEQRNCDLWESVIYQYDMLMVL